MDRYRVLTGVAKFGPGQQLELTAAQILPRRHVLVLPKGYDPKVKGAKSAVVTADAGVEFKKGEVIGLPDLPKHLMQQVEDIDGVAKAQAAREAEERAAAKAAKLSKAAKEKRDAKARDDYQGSAELQAQFKTADEYVASLDAPSLV